MMFIRWKPRTSRCRGKATTSLAAYLVTRVRTAKGPRQQHCAYLGTIALPTGRPPAVWARRSFWQQVEARLASLGLPAAQVARLCAALQQRLGPPPSEADLRHHDPELDVLFSLLRIGLALRLALSRRPGLTRGILQLPLFFQ